MPFAHTNDTTIHVNSIVLLFFFCLLLLVFYSDEQLCDVRFSSYRFKYVSWKKKMKLKVYWIVYKRHSNTPTSYTYYTYEHEHSHTKHPNTNSLFKLLCMWVFMCDKMPISSLRWIIFDVNYPLEWKNRIMAICLLYFYCFRKWENRIWREKRKMTKRYPLSI